MLCPLPIITFADIAAAGLRAMVYCPRCFQHRALDPIDPRWARRCFAGAMLRCSICRAMGQLEVHCEPIATTIAIKRFLLYCGVCFPPWEISDARPDRAPWDEVLGAGGQYRCPGCRGTLRTLWQGGSVTPGTDGYKPNDTSGEHLVVAFHNYDWDI